MNYDLFKLDLATGDVTRITRDIEYEDPIEASPDGKWYVVMSTRGVSSPSPAPEISVPEPTWATLLSELETPNVMVEGTLAGRVFGHAEVVYTASSSSNAFLGLDYSVEYFNYSDDGRTRPWQRNH